MAEPLALLQQLQPDWLIGGDSREIAQLTQTRLGEISRYGTEEPLTVLLTESDPIRFLASWLAACTAHCQVVMGNPTWGESEWQQVLALTAPDLIWGEGLPAPLLEYRRAIRPRPAQPGHILIPTGGSSGKIRFAVHTWDTLMASVQGFREYFECDRVQSCCVLPLYHVSGLMQFLRCLASGGRLAIHPFKQLESGILPSLDPAQFFISLVPTQLQRLLDNPELVDWLSQFQTVLLGGAPAWASLLDQAKQHRVPLALTYGMTETASQIVTLKPEQFLQGHRSCGQVLPHVRITLCNEAGASLGCHQIGAITIQATSLMLGYYPLSAQPQTTFQPDDLGYFDAMGELHLVGRSSDKIITGGENVFPAEVEAAIRATQLVQDVAVLGIHDRHWGEVVVAVYVPLSSAVTPDSLRHALYAKLSRYKYPKRWISVEYLPRNAQGKLNRITLKQWVEQA